MSRAGVQSPASLTDAEKPPLVYTMRELNQQTARIMTEIEKTERPGFITRHGRFIAMIVPLRPGQIEAQMLGPVAREIGKQLQH